MSYETLPPNAPSFKGDITASLIARLKNNAFHPTVEAVSWPAGYDEFVRKTNEAMSAVMVSDETGKTADIFTGSLNAYHLEHIPQQGTQIQVSDGVLDESLTNWQQGIVFFDTMPTGSTFVLTYMAQPDRYYGEYLTQISEILHKIEDFLGAGTTEGEGLRNAPVTLVGKSSNVGARMPHAVDLQALERDLTIQGVTQQNIRIGNGQDIVEIWTQRFRLRGDATGSLIEMLFGMNSGDTARFAGDAIVTGNLQVLGNLLVTGAQVINGGTVNVNDVVAQTRIVSEFESILGITTASMTYVGGGLDVTGEFRHLGVGNKNAKFDRNIELTDGVLRGVTHEGKVDGLNPSTVELHRKHYVGHDHKEGVLNHAIQEGILTGDAINTGVGYLEVTGGLAAIRAADQHDWTNKYSGGDWYATFLEFPNSSEEVGKSVPITGMDTGTNQISLSRNLRASPAGASFIIHHRHALPTLVRAGSGLSVTINASAAQHAVANRDGRLKIRRSSTTVLSLPDNSSVFIFMKTIENTNEIEEDEPSFFYREGTLGSTAGVESDEDVLLARVTTSGGVVTDVKNYRLNYRFDSLWLKIGAGAPLADGAQFVIDHMFGNPSRMQSNFPFHVAIADDTGGNPNVASVRVGHLTVSNTAAAVGEFQLVGVTSEQATVDPPTAAQIGATDPYWIRVHMG